MTVQLVLVLCLLTALAVGIYFEKCCGDQP